MNNTVNLKSDPISQTLDNKRFEYLVKFMKNPIEPILDIGSQNDFGLKVAQHYGISICNTDGDLDYPDWIPLGDDYYNAVWIFEVIEHLMNPALFLKELKDIIDLNTKIYVTYPFRSVVSYWSDTHFNEMDEKRFRTLVESCGYEIVRHEKHRLYRKWNFYLRGIRPLIRLFFVPYCQNYYELRLR